MFSLCHRLQESVSMGTCGADGELVGGTVSSSPPPPNPLKTTPSPPLKKALFCGPIYNKGRSRIEKVDDTCSLFQEAPCDTHKHKHTQSRPETADNGIHQCPVSSLSLVSSLYCILDNIKTLWVSDSAASAFPSECCEESKGRREGRG